MFLQEKPGWLVALICFIILAISLGFERLLHITGMHLKRTNRKPLYDALHKFKDELMLLGFISLLLDLVPEDITHGCVLKNSVRDLLPCDISDDEKSSKKHTCGHDETVLISHDDLKNIHEFIFCLVIIHVILSVLTVLSGEAKMRKWGRWEESQTKTASEGSRQRFVFLHEHDFIKRRYTGIRTYSTFLGWLAHCKENQKLNFHNYLLRMLEYEFETVLGISWYLWIYVVIFLLLNISGLKSYVWIAFIPVILILAIGAKLEHIMTQLAHDVAEKSTVIEGELVVKPSDAHFWFRRPQIILFLIHFIIFQNSFEITYLIWYIIQIRFDKCPSKKPKAFTVLFRLITGMSIRIFCSYSTLPLYALVTQMGTQIKNPVFEENVQDETTGGVGSTIRTSTDELQMVDLRISIVGKGNTHNVDEASTSEIVEND